jgi:hypothetical protein
MQANKQANKWARKKNSSFFLDLKILISTNNENPSIEKHMLKKITLSSISNTNTPTCKIIFLFFFKEKKTEIDREKSYYKEVKFAEEIQEKGALIC